METTSRLDEMLGEVIEQLRAQPLWQLSDTELNTRLSRLGWLRHNADVLLGQAAAAVDERGTVKDLGYTSAAAAIADTSPLNLTQSHQVTKLTARLHRLPDLDEKYRPVLDAYNHDQIPGPHADMIAKFLKKNCNRISDDATNAVIATLIAFAADADTQQLKNTIAILTESLDTGDDTPPPAEDRDLDSLHISRTLNGRVKIDGDLNKLCGEMLLELINALDVQQTGDENTTNARSREQLRHDAFEELLRRALAMAKLPDTGGRRPNVDLITDLDNLAGTNTEPSLFDHLTHHTDDDDDDEYGEEYEADCDTCDCTNHGNHDGDTEPHDTDTDDTETHGEKETHADCTDHNHNHNSTNACPGRRRTRNTFAEAYDTGLDAAIERTLRHAAKLPWGGAITRELARMIACDATITPILTRNGKPIDMGRTLRYATPALRHYLALRDGGCAFPGCRRPASWCDAHHIRWWSNNGTTDHWNLVLLCRHHHTLIHQSPWEIRMGADEIPMFIPPARVDPFRTPIPAAGRKPRAA